MSCFFRLDSEGRKELEIFLIFKNKIFDFYIFYDSFFKKLVFLN